MAKMLTDSDVRVMLADGIVKDGLRPFCREHKLDPSFTMRVLGGAKLSPSILKALGVEKAGTVTTYRRRK